MRYRSRVTAPATALIGTALALTGGHSAYAAPGRTGGGKGTPGPETLGDPVFPTLGNDGYRAGPSPPDSPYAATTPPAEPPAPLALRPPQSLPRFPPAPAGLDIRPVTVGNRPAAFEQAD